jgi:FixJ family two-component response regulator
VVFITGNGNIPMTMLAMQRDAVDVLTKPFDDQTLLDAIQHALGRAQ